MRKINADYSHRFSLDFIQGSYASLEEAFEQGNFTLVADQAAEGSELQGMAFVLGGLPEKGIRVLTALKSLSLRARVILAFGYWLVDQPHTALALLAATSREGADGTLADRLESLIKQKKINVCQVVLPPPRPGDRAHNDPLRAVEETVGQFVIRDYATQAQKDGCVEEDFAAHVQSLPVDERPDFVLGMVNHWFLPRNIEAAGVPLVMWTHDQDHFVHRMWDNYRLCTVNIVTTAQEHFEMARGCGTFVASNLLTDPFSASYGEPVLRRKDKDIDVLFTGTGFNFFLSDKCRFLFNLSRLSDKWQMLFVDGHLPWNEYVDAMARAKFVPVVSRVCGNPSPRWREVLETGGFLLYPEKTMFGRVTAGCYAYGEGSFVEDIKDHLEGYASRRHRRAYDHEAVIEQVKQDFALGRAPRSRQRERFLRFAAFMLEVRQCFGWQVPMAHPAPEPRRRQVWLSPSVNFHYFGEVNIFWKVLRALEASKPAPEWDEADYNNVALTALVLGFNTVLHHSTHGMVGFGSSAPGADDLLRGARELLEEGLRKFPKSLLLRFNQANWACMENLIIRPHQPGNWRALFEKLLVEFEALHFTPLNADVAVQHYHMFDPVFPHFEYGQHLVKYSVAVNNPDRVAPESLSDPRQILRAACHGYIGLAEMRNEKFESAIEKFDTALALHGDNLPLRKLRWDAFKQAVQGGVRITDHDNRMANAFFDCADYYPVVLLSDVQHVLEPLTRAKRTEDLRQLLLDWYLYAKCLDQNTLRKYANVDQLTALLARQTLLPEDLTLCFVSQRKSHLPMSAVEAWMCEMVNPGRAVEFFTLAAANDEPAPPPSPSPSPAKRPAPPKAPSRLLGVVRRRFTPLLGNVYRWSSRPGIRHRYRTMLPRPVRQFIRDVGVPTVRFLAPNLVLDRHRRGVVDAPVQQSIAPPKPEIARVRPSWIKRLAERLANILKRK